MNSLTSSEPEIRVGLLSAPNITVTFHGKYVDRHGNEITGTLTFDNSATDLFFKHVDNDCFFTLCVTIGINFHWQRRETQRFTGDLEIIAENETLTAVNIVKTEEYLESVISSEMNAGSPIEFLCAHAVISRSWLLNQIFRNEPYKGEITETDNEIVRWYDHQAHTKFHVCADDHCQRYQGVGKIWNENARKAIERTRGLVLVFDNKIADARFSKCCGGIMEQFSTCWQNIDLPYLQPLSDTPHPRIEPAKNEKQWEQWINSRPSKPYCATKSNRILQTVLNNYDLETTDFYRWTVTYTATELKEIITAGLNKDLGDILALKPLHRGPSGRIDRLEITGTKQKIIIGKELEIRRVLSRTHLYSSAFLATPQAIDNNGVPGVWIIKGAGWGHGVGLCQIGAAVMATEGIEFAKILAHYFPLTQLKKLY